MERETTTLKAQEHTFLVKTYATAKEFNAIQSAQFEGSKVEIVGEQPKISEFNFNSTYNVRLAMVEQLVVEMDGSKENIKERCEELPNDVFEELTGQLDDLVAKKKQ